MYNRTNLNDIDKILPENQEKAVKIIKKHIAEAKEWIADGIEAQPLILEIRQAMVQLFDFALENHRLEKLFRYFMKDLKSWLITLIQSSAGYDTEKTFLFPFLSECACIGNGIFNRFKNDIREKIESSVMDFLKNRIAVSDRKEIRYMSLGSGELLPDFIIINQLLLLLADSDRKEIKVEITLIDPIYENSTDNIFNVIDQFEYLVELAEELGILFSLYIHPSIDEYLTLDPKNQDVIMATDFEQFHTSAFKSAIKAHKILDQQGQMFLSFWKERYILSKTQSLSPLSAVSFLNQFPLKAKKHVKIASLIERNIFTVYPIILPYIQQLKDCESVTLTLPHPQKINKQGFWMGAKYPNMTISNADLHYFFSLFIPKNIKLTLNFVTGNKNFGKLLPQFNEDQHLVLCYDRQCKQGTEMLFKDIASVHNKFLSADILFEMQASSALQPEKTFSCRWIYEQAENSTNILKGNEVSVKILSDAYQYLVAENLKLSNSNSQF